MKLPYKLAKELSDASYLQQWQDGVWYQDKRMSEAEIFHYDTKYGYRLDPMTTVAVIIPTLSELIEDVVSFSNTKGFNLKFDNKGTWIAKIDSSAGLISTEGSIPEEAVARLWLKLKRNVMK